MLGNHDVDMIIEDESSYRLSRWLDGVYGGYRAGAKINLQSSTEYRMHIYCQWCQNILVGWEKLPQYNKVFHFCDKKDYQMAKY